MFVPLLLLVAPGQWGVETWLTWTSMTQWMVVVMSGGPMATPFQ